MRVQENMRELTRLLSSDDTDGSGHLKRERRHYSGFRFEAHWFKHADFMTVVQSA
jgi:hypothetical protein